MAERYVSELAVAGSGTAIDPWTLAEMLTAIQGGVVDNGDRCNVEDDGTYTQADVVITRNAGASKLLYITIEGMSNGGTPGDGGRPTIQRDTGEVGTWWDFDGAQNYFFKNLIFDGLDIGDNTGYLLYLMGNNNVIDCEFKNGAVSFAVRDGAYINCYIHDNVAGGTGGRFQNCLIVDNDGLGLSTAFAYYCIAKDSANNYRSMQMVISCISDGGAEGIDMLNRSFCMNCIIINATSVGVDAANNAPVVNCNFYNNTLNYTSAELVYNPYFLDPQFKDPASLDYRRTGSNLDGKGFSDVGIQGFDYGIDIGVDQAKVTIPVIGNVRVGVTVGRDANPGTGVLVSPSEDDVKDGVGYGAAAAEFEGNVELPAENEVEKNIGYGSDGTEFTGTAQLLVLDPPWSSEGISHSPAYIISQYLIGQDKLTDPTESEGDWPVYVGALPDGSNVADDAAGSMDTPSIKDGRQMGEEPLFHYGVQLLLRSREFNPGYAKAADLAVALAAIDQTGVIIGDKTYLIFSVTQTTAVVGLGQEEGTKRREMFSVNFLVSLREV